MQILRHYLTKTFYILGYLTIVNYYHLTNITILFSYVSLVTHFERLQV